jgi:GNAT superfamily N-acetyltransferase
MNVTVKSKLTEARLLYQTAFRQEERLPWSVLRLMTLLNCVSLNAYYDDSKFCGFTHNTVTDDYVFIMFFAVREDLRGSGYGSAILNYLKQQYSNKAIILNVEPLDERAANSDERIRRMRFYQKNGFYDTGYDIKEVGGVFRVLSTKPDLDVSAYLNVFRKLSFGFWKPELTHVKPS